MNLEYIKVAGDLIFKANLPSEDYERFAAGRRRCFPEWRSWAGLEGWIRTVREHIGLPYWVANLAVRNPGQDFSWLENLQESELAEMGAYSPFGHDISLDEKRDWYRNWRDKGFSFKTFVHNAREIQILGVNFSNFRYAKRLTDDFAVPASKLAAIADWWEKSAMEVRAQLAEVPVYLASKPLLTLESVRPIADMIQPSYWDGDTRVSSLLRAGVPHTEMARRMCGGTITRQEAVSLVQQMADRGILEMPRLAIPQVLQIRHPEIPTEWYQYIECLEVGDWVARHIPQLSKTRVVQGPAGQVATVHMHQLIGHITTEMLVNGPKTAWRIVKASLDEIAARQIADQLGEDRPLPKIPALKKGAPEFPEVTQLVTTHQLRDEGLRMNHCVGGYVQSCDMRKSYIFHVQDGTYAGATVEICPNPWRITQAMGPSNIKSERAWEIMGRYIKHLP